MPCAYVYLVKIDSDFSLAIKQNLPNHKININTKFMLMFSYMFNLQHAVQSYLYIFHAYNFYSLHVYKVVMKFLPIMNYNHVALN